MFCFVCLFFVSVFFNACCLSTIVIHISRCSRQMIHKSKSSHNLEDSVSTTLLTIQEERRLLKLGKQNVFK